MILRLQIQKQVWSSLVISLSWFHEKSCFEEKNCAPVLKIGMLMGPADHWVQRQQTSGSSCAGYASRRNMSSPKWWGTRRQERVRQVKVCATNHSRLYRERQSERESGLFQQTQLVLLFLTQKCHSYYQPQYWMDRYSHLYSHELWKI